MSSTTITSCWLRIIQINDVYELDNLPRLKTLIAEHSLGNGSTTTTTTTTTAPTTVIVACAGDFLAPSLLSSLDHGASMMDCLRAVGVTHVCLGNHEADVPLSALKQRIRVPLSKRVVAEGGGKEEDPLPDAARNNRITWINSNMPELNAILSVELPKYDIVTVATRTLSSKTHDDHHNDGVDAVGVTKPPKKVALLGLLTDDPSLYRPGAFGGAKIDPIVPCAEALVQQLQHEVDLVIPLTHQSMADDRAFGQRFTGRTFPLVCGGHDHEVYNEVVAGSRIVKAGMDAMNAAVIDIQWRDCDEKDKEGTAAAASPTIQVQIVPTRDYAPCPVMQQRIESHQRILQELERARLFCIRDWMVGSSSSSNNNSSNNKNSENTADDSSASTSTNNVLFSTRDNRWAPSTGTSVLCTMLRMGLRAQCAVINAGAVRGNKVYNNNEYFCWSDLKAEIPFTTSMTACYIPGKVLEATIAYSRRGSRQTPPQASGGYLHTCRNIVFNDQEGRIESIGGNPMDPDREYLTALPAQFFAGIDNQKPLLEWAARSPQNRGLENGEPLYSEEMAIPAKMVLVQVFSALLWLQLGTFDEIDGNQDGVLQYEEVRARVLKLYGDESVADLVLQNLFSVADMNGDGTITPLEMMIIQFAATDLVSHVCTDEELQTMREVASHVLGKHPSHDDVHHMVKQLFATMDLEGDGKIQRSDVMKIVGRLKASELLK